MRAAVQLRKLTGADELAALVSDLGLDLPVDTAIQPDGPLARPVTVPLGDASGSTTTVSNRFCILPMEGWDGTGDGRPTDLVERRWSRFGASGAKLIWGGEAVAVRADGRANPHQLCIGPTSIADLSALRQVLVAEHELRHGSDGLLVGLQLTHSGRFARPGPDGSPSPRVAYRHPVLDRRLDVEDRHVLTDAELDDLVDAFVVAANVAGEAGFDFVDVKHCHGYLGHELLSAVDRPGRYGGDLESRTAFLAAVVAGIRTASPSLGIGLRLSAYDLVPYRAVADGDGEPEPFDAPYRHAFGGDGTGHGIDLTEPHALLDLVSELGIGLICVTAGSPYYNPHIQRPAYFPPSDGYTPPEDPLVGVARMVDATAQLKREHPHLVIVGSGYSYLQEWLPHVAQAVVRAGMTDLIGVGRMALSYPELPAHVLTGAPLDRRRICRTFSDCTTAPRNGVISGCYPLDDFYKARPERRQVAAAKRVMVGRPARGGSTAP